MRISLSTSLQTWRRRTVGLSLAALCFSNIQFSGCTRSSSQEVSSQLTRQAAESAIQAERAIAQRSLRHSADDLERKDSLEANHVVAHQPRHSQQGEAVDTEQREANAAAAVLTRSLGSTQNDNRGAGTSVATKTQAVSDTSISRPFPEETASATSKSAASSQGAFTGTGNELVQHLQDGKSQGAMHAIGTRTTDAREPEIHADFTLAITETADSAWEELLSEHLQRPSIPEHTRTQASQPRPDGTDVRVRSASSRSEKNFLSSHSGKATDESATLVKSAHVQDWPRTPASRTASTQVVVHQTTESTTQSNAAFSSLGEWRSLDDLPNPDWNSRSEMPLTAFDQTQESATPLPESKPGSENLGKTEATHAAPAASVANMWGHTPEVSELVSQLEDWSTSHESLAEQRQRVQSFLALAEKLEQQGDLKAAYRSALMARNIREHYQLSIEDVANAPEHSVRRLATKIWGNTSAVEASENRAPQIAYVDPNLPRIQPRRKQAAHNDTAFAETRHSLRWQSLSVSDAFPERPAPAVAQIDLRNQQFAFQAEQQQTFTPSQTKVEPEWASEGEQLPSTLQPTTGERTSGLVTRADLAQPQAESVANRLSNLELLERRMSQIGQSVRNQEILSGDLELLPEVPGVALNEAASLVSEKESSSRSHRPLLAPSDSSKDKQLADSAPPVDQQARTADSQVERTSPLTPAAVENPFSIPDVKRGSEGSGTSRNLSSVSVDSLTPAAQVDNAEGNFRMGVAAILLAILSILVGFVVCRRTSDPSKGQLKIADSKSGADHQNREVEDDHQQPGPPTIRLSKAA